MTIDFKKCEQQAWVKSKLLDCNMNLLEKMYALLMMEIYGRYKEQLIDKRMAEDLRDNARAEIEDINAAYEFGQRLWKSVTTNYGTLSKAAATYECDPCRGNADNLLRCFKEYIQEKEGTP